MTSPLTAATTISKRTTDNPTTTTISVTTAERTTSLEGGTTSQNTTHIQTFSLFPTLTNAHNPAVPVLPIVLPIVACIIIILAIVFVLQRRGSKKRAKYETNNASDLKVTQRTNRGNGPSDLNQLPKSANAHRQSDSMDGTSRGRALTSSRPPSTVTKIEVEKPKSARGYSVDSPRKSWLTGREGAASEPHYVNFAQSQSPKSSQNDNETDSEYLDLSPSQGQAIPRTLGIAQSNLKASPINSQSQSRPVSRVNQPQQAVSQGPSQTLYENLQRPDPTIYENTHTGQDEDNFYEEAMRKEEGDVYVDMK